MIIDGEEYLYEKRENISKEYWEENINSRYNAYPRAREDKNGVREFESEFIFTTWPTHYHRTLKITQLNCVIFNLSKV